MTEDNQWTAKDVWELVGAIAGLLLIVVLSFSGVRL